MTGRVNIRELILGILLEINKEGQYSHIAIRSTLEKYQYLEKQSGHLSQECVKELRRTRYESIYHQLLL